MKIKEQIKAEIERRFWDYGTPLHDDEVTKKVDEILSLIDSLPDEPSENIGQLDSERAAEEYANKHPFKWPNQVPAGKEGFIAGAEWQKEQMMKEAYVESQIVEDGRIELEGNPLPCLNPIILLPYPQFKPNNKVKIVIIKEDEI